MHASTLGVNVLVALAAAAGLGLAAVGTLLVLSGALAAESAPPFSWFAGALEQADSLRGGEEALAYALCVVALLCAVALLLLQLRLLGAQPAAALVIDEDELGLTTIERDTAESYLSRAARSVTWVEQAAIRARPLGDQQIGVAAQLTLASGRAFSIRQTAAAAREAITQASSEDIGLDIKEIDVTTAMRPSRRNQRRRIR